MPLRKRLRQAGALAGPLLVLSALPATDEKKARLANRLRRETSPYLLQDEKVLAEAKEDFQKRMKGRKYTTRIPAGQKAPKSIR